MRSSGFAVSCEACLQIFPKFEGEITKYSKEAKAAQLLHACTVQLQVSVRACMRNPTETHINLCLSRRLSEIPNLCAVQSGEGASRGFTLECFAEKKKGGEEKLA